MKILGIDYGEKRIGLALSDESFSMAWPYDILSPKDFWKKIEDIIVTEEIVRLVLGLPLNMKGEKTQKTLEVESFKIKLENSTGLPVEFVDERLSSKIAEGALGKKTYNDDVAAQIFLQNFLDKGKQ